MKFIIPVVLLAAVLSSCGNSKVNGIVTVTTPIFGSENSNDTIHIVPTGTVLEYAGEAPPSYGYKTTGRTKVKFNGADGYVGNQFFVLNVKPAVMKEDIEAPSMLDGGSTITMESFAVYDSVANNKVHVYAYADDAYQPKWIDASKVEMDTAKAAVFALFDALNSSICNEETYAMLSKVAASHSTHPLLQAIKVDLSEAPDSEVKIIQRKYGLLLDKSRNQVFTSKETATGMVNTYVNDVFALPPDGQEVDEYNSPRLKYFYNYICALPSFVKLVPKSMAVNWGFPKDADSLKSYLLYRTDRSADNIRSLYEIFKPGIIQLLESGSVQDVRPDMEALITAYDRIVAMPNHRDVISDVRRKVAEWDKENTDENGINNSVFTMVEQGSIYEPIVDTEKYDLRNDGKGIWYSSFWTRRFAEGNEKVVYDILKELVKIQPAAQADSEDESNETEVITCTFQDAGVGDCGHVIFSCGDYGDADVSALSEEDLKLWRDLSVDDETNGTSANPKYVGKSFSIRAGVTKGEICNEGQGGEGTVPRLLEFKLLN